LRELERRDVPGYLDTLGTRLRDGYTALCEELGTRFTRCVGYGCRTMVTFTPPSGTPPQSVPASDALVMKSFVQQELLKHGVLWNGFHNLSAAHTGGDVDYLLGAYRELLPRLRAAVEAGTLPVLLRGEPVEAVFRRTTNFNVKPARRAADPALPATIGGTHAGE
jgi:glutamate-1-semialdehyde 2,1-aminomutase/spore coat polysaccharide biosynthesis protein SpsF